MLHALIFCRSLDIHKVITQEKKNSQTKGKEKSEMKRSVFEVSRFKKITLYAKLKM